MELMHLANHLLSSDVCTMVFYRLDYLEIMNMMIHSEIEIDRKMAFVSYDNPTSMAENQNAGPA
jgi:hypothetical protein